MDEMLALLGDHTSRFLIEQFFLERLLEDVRVHLAGAQFTDCRLLAKKADAYWVSRDTGFSANANQQRTSSGQKSKAQHCPPLLAKVCYYHRTYGKQLANCDHPVTGREKGRPVANDGLGGWLEQSSFFYVTPSLDDSFLLTRELRSVLYQPPVWTCTQHNQDHRCWQLMAAPSKLMVHTPFPFISSTSGLSLLLMFLGLCWEQIFSAQTLS